MTECESLRQACEAWLRAVLAVVRGRAIPQRVGFEVVLTPDGHESRSVMLPDYGRLVLTVEAILMALPETEVILRLVRDTPALGVLLVDGSDTPRPPAEQKQWLVTNYLDKLAGEYLQRVPDTNFDPATFAWLYEQLEQFIYHYEAIEVFWLVQLRNLQTDVEVVELEPGVRLRRATHEEQVQAEEGSFSFQLVPGWMSPLHSSPGLWTGPFDADQFPYAFLEVRGHPSLPRYHVQVDVPRPWLRRLLVLLRLLDPHQVAPHSTWYVDTNPFHFGTVPRQPHDEVMPKAFAAGAYIITAEIAAKLQTLWPKVDHALADRTLALAFDRLNDSSTRKKPEDKLIDYWVALEALFATDGTQELKYRASLRIARFVGETAEERQTLFQQIRASYDLRSDVVHGGDPTSKRRQRLPAVVEETGATLRRVLARCIERGEPPRLADIDAELLV